LGRVGPTDDVFIYSSVVGTIHNSFPFMILIYYVAYGTNSLLYDEVTGWTDYVNKQYVAVKQIIPTPVIVQCLRSDSSCFGHYNRS